MKVSDFILIQVNHKDKFYELARVRPYLTKNNQWDLSRGFYCDGFGQNNGSFYEFSLHLGKEESDIKNKFILIGHPVTKLDGQIVEVS